jgi:predicted Zn-dependent peptidase
VITAHHRPGAVQSQTRLTSGGVLRTDPGYAAAQLANIVFGGYFSSRLVENLREDKGFTYHAHSALEFWPGRSAMTISYDTATDVAAAALVETRHELGRIALTPPADAEIDAARNYAIGSLAASLATQAGYASMLTTLAGVGLDQSWLAAHQKNLRAATAEQVADAASRLFAPSAMTGVIVGDLEASGAALARLDGIKAAQ